MRDLSGSGQSHHTRCCNVILANCKTLIAVWVAIEFQYLIG